MICIGPSLRRTADRPAWLYSTSFSMLDPNHFSSDITIVHPLEELSKAFRFLHSLQERLSGASSSLDTRNKAFNNWYVELLSCVLCSYLHKPATNLVIALNVSTHEISSFKSMVWASIIYMSSYGRSLSDSSINTVFPRAWYVSVYH